MNKFLWIVAVVLLAMNAVLCINYWQYKRQASFRLQVLQGDMKSLIPLQENWESAMGNDGYRLDGIQGKDANHNLVGLNEMFLNHEDKILVCRFSELDCESCIDYAIKSMKEYSVRMGIENILYLGNYRNNRIFNRQRAMCGIDSCRSLNVAKLGLPIEDLNQPYYFVLDSSLLVSNVFIPNKTTQRMLNTYFDVLCDKYFAEE